MYKSLLIKVPTVALIALALLFLPAPWSWLSAALVGVVGIGALMAIVVNANSSFWVETRWRAPRRTDAVALTFDDGPDPEFTPQILDMLAARGITAAFFVVGERARQHPELLVRMHAEGHVVGNHTDSHGLDFHFRLCAGRARDRGM